MSVSTSAWLGSRAALSPAASPIPAAIAAADLFWRPTPGLGAQGLALGLNASIRETSPGKGEHPFKGEDR